MKFPTYKEMGEKIAEQALDEYVINGKTLREWIKLLSEREPCTEKNCDTCINKDKCSPNIREIVRKNGCPKWTPNKDMYKPLLPMGKYPKTSFPCDSEDDVKQTKQEPCDDVVSRQAVLDVIYGQHIGGKEAVEHGLRNTYAGDLREIADEIIALPSVRPQEQKTGEWIALENRFELGDRLKCSECGQVFVVGDDVSRKYCPNCGARMVEPQESEDKG